MRRIAEIQIEMSEARARLNNPEAELPETEQTEIRNRLVALEADLQSEIRTLEEARERRELDAQFTELRGGIELRNYMNAAVNDADIEGREREFNSELKLTNRNSVPWEAFLDRDDPADRTEDRADTVADLSGAAAAKPRMPVIERVFRRSDAAFLGVEMPSVGAGEPNYPVMTAGAAGSAAAENAAVDAEATTFVGHSVEPRRGANARYLFSAETLAKFGAGTEDLLRRDARRVLTKVFDDQIISGDGTGSNLKGMLHSDNVDATGVSNPSNVAVPTDFDGAFADQIDGLYAYSSADVRLLMGRETLVFMSKNRVDAGSLDDEGGRLYSEMLPMERYRASTRVAAPASNIQKAYAFRPAEIRAIAPVWQGVTMIRDPYTQAAKGQVSITLMMLFGFVQPRGKSKEARFKLA